MRQLLYTSLTTALAGEGLTGIYQLGSLGVDGIPANPSKPFMTMRQMPSVRYREVRETSKAEKQVWNLYVYDEPGSLLRVDRILREAEDAVVAMEGVRSVSGAWCFEALWLGISQDFKDENYGAVARFATIQLSTNNG